jgi:hypothetical protein
MAGPRTPPVGRGRPGHRAAALALVIPVPVLAVARATVPALAIPGPCCLAQISLTWLQEQMKKRAFQSRVTI